MKHLILALVATCFAAAVRADAEEDELAALAAPATNTAAPKIFMTLPVLKEANGDVTVRVPGGKWERADEGHHYPFGTHFRTGAKATAVIDFGATSFVTLSPKSEVATRFQPVGQDTRAIVPCGGEMLVRLPANLPAGGFSVAAPGFAVTNMIGTSKITYQAKGDGDFATIRCQTGTFGIEGRHFVVPSMTSSHEIGIRTSSDHLVTVVYGRQGSYIARIDQGLCFRQEFTEEGEATNIVEEARLDWKLSPKTRVVITRAVPAIGSRMSVHTMVFDMAGELKSERSFSEGRPEVNSGELVSKTQEDNATLAKRAAEVTGEKPAASEDGEDGAETPAGSGEEASSDDE